MAQALDITSALLNAQNPDPTVRNQAEEQLSSFRSRDLASYLLSLASELANNQKPAESRQIAGLLLKNSLDAPSEANKAELNRQWQALDQALKQHIKQLLLSALTAEEQVARHTSALAIAKVAAIELPVKQWQELIPKLLESMQTPTGCTGLKQATLETFGYVCEEMGRFDEVILDQEQVNNVLTAVVQGTAQQEDKNVRLAAITALFNALEFAHTNFENDGERDYLMQVICQCTTDAMVQIKERSFECLVRIAALHYDKLRPYMQEIFNLVQRAVKDQEEDVAKQGIEFWCTVCEEEIDVQVEQDEGDSTVINHHLVKQALQPLVEMLLQQLTKQEEEQDKEEGIWNLSMAAGTCLGLVANTVSNDVIPLVLPFVTENIGKTQSTEDWRHREAATFAFGSIMEGLSAEEAAKLVGMGMGFLCNALRDPNTQVRHTTAWTIGRIFEKLQSSGAEAQLLNTDTLPKIIQVLLESIHDEPHIAEKVCYAICQLAAGLREAGAAELLSQFFKEIVQALLEAGQRACEPQAQARLQLQAFEAINEVVRGASDATQPLVGQLVPLMISKLQQTFQAAPPGAPADVRARQQELQGLLCGVLQVIVQKLSDGDAAKSMILLYVDTIMEVLLTVFQAQGQQGVHEEAMLAVGALTYASGKGFLKYMPGFFPFLKLGLANHQEWQVCQVSVGVLGDVCRALDDQMMPFCGELLPILLQNLQSNDVHRNVKPGILSCFGDLVLAVGDKFEEAGMLPTVLSMLQSAQQLSVMQQQSSDEESLEYNTSLRISIFEAYSGIFNGLSAPKISQYLKAPAESIVQFTEYVYNDRENADDGVRQAAVSLFGDIAAQLPGSGPLFQSRQYIQELVRDCRSSDDQKLVSSAQWAQEAIQKAVMAR
ncbi:hypothetical protein WJX84_011194 [Apatococcus fuscideae]|uniref:Importin N-terminal domain-containing protein n=1 Tax=Apatococcus fuscideae TaxID=2026836 RepID=A0AAW1SX07_9CHLO